MAFFSNIKLVLGGAILAIILVGYIYIQYIESELNTIKDNNITLQSALDTQNIVIERMKTDIKVVQESYYEYTLLVNQQAESMEELQRSFNESSSGQSRSIGQIAESKPQLVENIINRGTRKVNRCFEILTGSALQEGEEDDCK